METKYWFVLLALIGAIVVCAAGPEPEPDKPEVDLTIYEGDACLHYAGEMCPKCCAKRFQAIGSMMSDTCVCQTNNVCDPKLDLETCDHCCETKFFTKSVISFLRFTTCQCEGIKKLQIPTGIPKGTVRKVDPLFKHPSARLVQKSQ